MNPQPLPAGVRLVGRRLRFHRYVVFIRDTAGAEVRGRVVWKPPGWLYRCDACGTTDHPRCTHALAASQLTRPTL